MTIALLPAPRTHPATLAHTSIVLKFLEDCDARKWQHEHPVTRVVFAQETVTTTTRTVIAVERKA